jgi:molecular chaperone DnaK
MSTYRLGLDLGTTFTAAAVCDGSRTESVALGDVAAQIPSTVFLRADGSLLFGDAAVQRGVTAPERLAREFKRRIGDPTALLLGGTPMSAHSLTGHLLRYAVNVVTERHGGPPARLVLTHPANWGGYRLELLQQAVQIAGLGPAELLPEPAAAAAHFASTSRLDVGDIAAIYDLGGGTFDAAVVRRTAETFDVLGEPQGLEHLGGLDFDAAVLAHVIACAGLDPTTIDPDDELAMVSLDRLRRECTNAKIQLSSDSDVTIPVDVPGVRTTVRLGRGEFEEAVRPALRETVTAFGRALTSAKVSPAELRAVVLVGGSARIPLVKELLTADLQRPVVVSPQPKQSVALGAAMLGTAEPAPGQAGTAQRATAKPATTEPATARPVATPAIAGTSRRAAPARRRQVVGAVGTAVIAILIALVGPSTDGPVSAGSTRISGQSLTRPVLASLGKPVEVSGLSGNRARMRLTILGLSVADQAAVVTDGRAAFHLDAARLVIAGPVHAQITDATAHTFLLRPAQRPFLASIPGAVCIVGALFVAAYVESVLRGMRRRRHRRIADTVSLSALGALTGVLLVVTVWGLAGRLLAPVTVVIVLGAASAVGGLLCAALSPAAAAPADAR